MIKLKNISYHLLVLLMCIGFGLISYSCNSDDDDEAQILPQTFLEKYDGTKWVVNEEGLIVYLRLNNDMSRPVELWVLDLDVEKGMTNDDCYYYTNDLLDIDAMEILEHSINKLVFTNVGYETWELRMEGNRLTLEYETRNRIYDPLYFEKTNLDFDSFDICPEEFEFLNRFNAKFL